MRNVYVGVGCAAAAAALIAFRHPLMGWLQSDPGGLTDLMLIGIAGLLLAIVPAVPYGIVAAVMGAKFGTAIGMLVNVTISIVASISLFALVRYGFSAAGRAKASNIRGLKSLTAYAERHPFFAVFVARILPIVPAQAVAVYAAATRMPWVPYVWATVLGKIPFTVFVTRLGDRFVRDAKLTELLAIGCAYAAFVAIVYGVYRCRRKAMGSSGSG